MGKMTVAIIEDNTSDLEQIDDYCKEVGKELGITIETKTFNSVEDFKSDLEKAKPDLMVVDLRLGASRDDRSGWKTVKEVLTHEIIPVIVYSAYSGQEPEEIFKNLLIVRIIKGDEEVERFKQILTNFMRLKLKFNQEKERITMQFGKLSLETVREILGEGETGELDESTLAMMAVGRLASYLLNVPSEGKEQFPPESIFIYPPLEIHPYPTESLFLGDFLEKRENNNSGKLWLVISPSCDLVFTNARKTQIRDVLLLRCYRNYTKVPFLMDKPSENNRKNALEDRIRGNTAKILKCPPRIFKSKYILVSLKDYKTLPYAEISGGIRKNTWKKLATLATPYAESLQNLFIRDISRIGTPATITSKEEKQWGKEFVKNVLSQRNDV